MFNGKYCVPISLFCDWQSKEAGIKTLVALDDQGGKFDKHICTILNTDNDNSSLIVTSC